MLEELDVRRPRALGGDVEVTSNCTIWCEMTSAVVMWHWRMEGISGVKESRQSVIQGWDIRARRTSVFGVRRDEEILEGG
jgi:hypothetical protein